MASSLDRRCAEQVREIENKIAQCERILARISHKINGRYRQTFKGVLRQRIQQMRESWIVELHDMKRAHDTYDRRLAEAYDDPTGQDLDSFYERFGEGEEPRRMEY